MASCAERGSGWLRGINPGSAATAGIAVLFLVVGGLAGAAAQGKEPATPARVINDQWDLDLNRVNTATDELPAFRFENEELRARHDRAAQLIVELQ